MCHQFPLCLGEGWGLLRARCLLSAKGKPGNRKVWNEGMKMPGISLEELTWFSSSCVVGSRPRTHEASQEDGLIETCKRIWQALGKHKGGCLRDKGNGSCWWARAGRWGKKESTKSRETAALFSVQVRQTVTGLLLLTLQMTGAVRSLQAVIREANNCECLINGEVQSKIHCTGGCTWRQQCQTDGWAKSVNFGRSHSL